MEDQISMGDQFLASIIRIIEENIDNENFSVEHLADKAGLSRSMLHRKIKKLTGKSVSDYITIIRLNHAKKLLKNNVATVSEVAFRVGFSNPSYFIKVFKNYFDVTPGDVLKDPKIKLSQLPTGLKSDILSPAKSKISRSLVLTIVIIILIITGAGLYYFFNLRKSKERSIAVLPLKNITGQPGNDYFIEGMHDALIGELGKIESLRVISRTSTLRYRDSNMLLPDIAKELGVNIIVEGTVQCLGDSLCFIMQMINVFPKERHLLSNEYYDDMHNVLKLQSNAVKDIAQKIRIKLTKDEEQLLAKTHTINPESYKAYLRGMYHLNQGTEESFDIGIKYLAGAIKKDPGDPFAYAGLALGYAIRGHGAIVPPESFRSAVAAAEKALIIDPTSAEAHTALALIYLYQHWDWPKAKDAFEKAITSNPNNEIAHAHFAWYHVLMGDMEKSIYHSKTAVDLNPLSAAFASWLAWLYFINEEYDNAEYWAKKSLEMNKDVPWGNVVLGWTYLEKKQYEKAIEAHEKLPGNTPRWKYFRVRTYLLAGNREKAMEIWNETEEYAEKNWVNPYFRGLMACTFGFNDKAFELLNDAYINRYYPITYIESSPESEFIKDDPRYHALLQKMNLPYNKTLITSLE
ncbi:MAG: helix-turn-helix domain-containing protein [Bacteroidales bacterium]|nr:MAG: helix-turn-helix domain-containing protein [Bacteroidales bacterium]